MSKLFVVYGYCGPDNYTSGDGPVLAVKEFDRADQVEAFYKEFQADLGKDDSQVVFRVFEGVERLIRPVERVTEYKLS